MSRKENLISELHPRKGTWKIAVRITDMWDVKKHNGRQAIDMVFIDQTIIGVKIEATLWQELFPEFQPKLALDVVGVVAKVIEQKIVNPAYKVTVKLRDNSDAEILMTLWEDYALQLDDAIEKNHFVRESLVLMLTLAKIKDAKEEGSGLQSQYTSNSQRGDRDKFLHNAQMVNLGDISRLRDDCFCLTVATVDDVLIDTPWSYDSFPNCTTTYKLVLGGDKIKVSPECVDDLVGKTLALRFKYRVNMRQSSVMDVSQEEHHIQTLTFKIGLQVIVNLS
ncbi:hypothetical protein glysoja_031299 [Glycine soja]|uniref:Replication protein A 70 kDa DNA-binding subunit B/D first OB fold domain-containing protein n=1 Tax=Glycine soja TaxID=3848 RepID=A0A0B2PXU0_GLYSO|nr:hypothetical protein glysoja_031299 [Glycine soja]